MFDILTTAVLQASQPPFPHVPILEDTTITAQNPLDEFREPPSLFLKGQRCEPMERSGGWLSSRITDYTKRPVYDVAAYYKEPYVNGRYTPMYPVRIEFIQGNFLGKCNIKTEMDKICRAVSIWDHRATGEVASYTPHNLACAVRSR
jgi:hypothetical protein